MAGSAAAPWPFTLSSPCKVWSNLFNSKLQLLHRQGLNEPTIPTLHLTHDMKKSVWCMFSSDEQCVDIVNLSPQHADQAYSLMRRPEYQQMNCATAADGLRKLIASTTNDQTIVEYKHTQHIQICTNTGTQLEDRETHRKYIQRETNSNNTRL